MPEPTPDSPGPCDAPLTYRIGEIDPRYDVSEAELRRIMQEVGALWSEAVDRKLLAYSESGRVAIHLVYSAQQKATTDRGQLEDRIATRERAYELVENRYRMQSNTYEEHRSRYEALLAEYNTSADAYNEAVSKWGDRGGVPPHKREEFEQRGDALQQLHRKVHRYQQKVETLRQTVNETSSELNAIAEQLNALIARYNRRFGRYREFDQGKYMKKNGQERIEVYQFSSRNDLALVLAHEVGHALGLGHVSNAESIMHYLRDKQNPLDLTLSEEDVAAIRAQCGK